jgi:hypothetical protein
MDVAAIKALLPDTTRYLQQAVDIPLSSTLSAEDCDHLVRAVRRVAAAIEPAEGWAGGRLDARLDARPSATS